MFVEQGFGWDYPPGMTTRDFNREFNVSGECCELCGVSLSDEPCELLLCAFEGLATHCESCCPENEGGGEVVVELDPPGSWRE